MRIEIIRTGEPGSDGPPELRGAAGIAQHESDLVVWPRLLFQKRPQLRPDVFATGERDKERDGFMLKLLAFEVRPLGIAAKQDRRRMPGHLPAGAAQLPQDRRDRQTGLPERNQRRASHHDRGCRESRPGQVVAENAIGVLRTTTGLQQLMIGERGGDSGIRQHVES